MFITGKAATQGKVLGPNSLRNKAIQNKRPVIKPVQQAKNNAQTLGRVIRGSALGPRN